MEKLLDILNKECNNRGSYIPTEELKQKCLADNRMTEAEYQKAIRILQNAGSIKTENDRIYLARVWQQEAYAAERLNLLLAKPPLQPVELPDDIRVGDIRLTAEQREAVRTCLNHRLTLLLAPAGCGKTTVSQAIIQYAGTDRFLLCSPTGKAAKNLSDHTNLPAATVHRTLGIRRIEDFLDVEPMDDIDLILVDEATMMTVDMLAGLLRAASENCRIVLLGDQNQLPAVGPGNVVNELVALGFPVAKLAQNHRLRGNDCALRKNVLSYDALRWTANLDEDESFLCRYSDDTDALLNELVTEAVKRYRAGESVQVLTFLRHDVLEINRRIQLHLNPPVSGKMTLEYRGFVFADSDRVILTANDNSRGCFNGETDILHISETGAYSVELDDGRRPEWSELDIPDHILPAYAITVHRAQGSEYDSVLLYVPRCCRSVLHRNSFYAGISRAKQRLLLYGERNAVSFALSNPPYERHSALAEKAA